MNSNNTLKQASNRSIDKAPKHKRGAVLHGVIIFGGIVLAGSALGYLVVDPVKSDKTVDNREVVKAILSSVPQVEIQPAKIDFGEVQKGTTVQQKIKIVNTGSVPAKIVDITTTCGCTVAEKPTKPILAGEFVEIEVRMNVNSILGKTITKTLSIQIEGSNTPLYLQVSSTAAEVLNIEPEVIKQISDEWQNVTVRSMDGRDFQILSIKPPVLCQDERTINSVHELTFKPKSWLEYGAPSKIKINTDHPKANSITVPIRKIANINAITKSQEANNLEINPHHNSAVSSKSRITGEWIKAEPNLLKLDFVGKSEEVTKIKINKSGDQSGNELPVVSLLSTHLEVKVISGTWKAGTCELEIKFTPIPGVTGRDRSLLQIWLGDVGTSIEVFSEIIDDQDMKLARIEGKQS